MEVWTLWQPTYWLSAGITVVTAVASVATALLLPPLIPRALALPSPGALERANEQLSKAHREVRSRLQVGPAPRRVMHRHSRPRLVAAEL